jgi:hypothetical protein
MAKAKSTEEFDRRFDAGESVFEIAEVKRIKGHEVTHGGARPGAGRKAKTGWIKVAFKMKAETAFMLRDASAKTGKSQSDLVDSILEKSLRKIAK